MKKLTLLSIFLLCVNLSFVSCKNETEREEEFETVGTEIEEPEMEEDGFGEFDLNDDGMWDENEFGESDEGFADFDENSDNMLDNNEFYNSNFENVDLNDDDTLTEEEWNQQRDNFANYSGDREFSEFDADGDGALTNEEWNTGFEDSEWFGLFDENDDELIDDNEWDSGWFSDWDDNEDGFVDNDEYGRYAETEDVF